MNLRCVFSNQFFVIFILKLFNSKTKMVSQVSLIATKKALRKKNDDNEVTANLRSATQVTAIKPENIWDLITVHGFLEAICRYENQLINTLPKIQSHFGITYLDAVKMRICCGKNVIFAYTF